MFVSRSSSFSVVHVNVDIEVKSKERIVFVVVVFISKRPGSYAIYRRNARLLEMQHLIPAYMKGWTVRTDVPRGCTVIDYQIFLPRVLRRARESSAITICSGYK